MLKAKLGIGPMSTEIIEAVYRYSHYHRTELMLIPSKNQIDHSGGYVNNWTTKDFTKYAEQMKQKYPYSNVKICRDHCGPGFNGNNDLNDVYNSIESDIKNRFDLIHIDFCHFQGNKEETFAESKKAIEFCLKLNPNIMLEIGTDENQGSTFTFNDLSTIEEEVNFFKKFCNPEFYVVQTGSLVKEINQVGNFNREFIEKTAKILHNKGLKLKEHNADYLSRDHIELRNGVIDAMNIAPQLGAIQTNLVLTKCLMYGVDSEPFLKVVHNEGKWKKWLHKNVSDNKLLCSVIAGHYHFSSPEYKEIIQQLEKHEDIHESIINATTEVIEHYDNFRPSQNSKQALG